MLGPLAWPVACEAVGLSLVEFPDTTDEAVKQLGSGLHYA